MKVPKDSRIDIWMPFEMAAEIVQIASEDERAVSATARRLLELALVQHRSDRARAQFREMLAQKPASRPNGNGYHQQAAE